MENKLFKFGEKKSIDREARTVTAWASQPVIDRDGEVILATAWQHEDSTADFERNPVLMPFHNYQALPLGKVVELEKSKKGLKFKAVFAKSMAANEAFNVIADLGLASFSVGFLSKSYQDLTLKEVAALGIDTSSASSERIRTYDHVQLLEISLAPIPSNPRATALGAAFMDGQIKTKELRQILEPWQQEIDRAEASTRIEETLQTALTGINVKTLLGGAIDRAMSSTKKEVINDVWRSQIKSAVLEAWREKVQQEKATLSQHLKRSKAEQFNPNDPAAVEKLVTETLENIDFEKLTKEQIQLAVDRQRGKVY